MIKNLIDKILYFFGKKKNYDETELQKIEQYSMKYEDNKELNITAVFANKLSNLAVSDCSIDIVGDDKRSELLKKELKVLKKKIKKIASRVLGTGGALVIPYVSDGKMGFNIVSQSRLIINKIVGEDIIDCTILAERITKGTTNYYRWADYVLNNRTLTIKYRATTDTEIVELSTIPEWSMLEDIVIPNVDKMLFMYLKSPIDNRKESDLYGVPITYGCDKEIKDIKDTIRQILREYDLKEAFIGADSTMFKGDGALPENGLYRRINAGEDNFWEVFSPEIRDSALFGKLMNQCALLEKQIGTSRGILSDRDTNSATATEIKSSQHDTFTIVDDLRNEIAEGLDDFVYACDVLANYYNLTPQGKYEVSCDWDYSLLEDTQATFNQLILGLNNGVIKKVELRQFLKPEETIEEAQKIIDEIESKPEEEVDEE